MVLYYTVINMLDIDKLAKYKEVYVIGHTNPDADSIFSSYILSKILKQKGINAKFSVLKDYYSYSYEDEKVIKTFLKEDPVILDNTITKSLIPKLLEFLLTLNLDRNRHLDISLIASQA